MILSFLNSNSNVDIYDNGILINSIPKNIYTILKDVNDPNHIRICLKENSESNIFDFYFSDVVSPLESNVDNLILQLKNYFFTDQNNYGLSNNNLINDLINIDQQLIDLTDDLLRSTNEIKIILQDDTIYDIINNYDISINNNSAIFNEDFLRHKFFIVEIFGTISGAGNVNIKLQQSSELFGWVDISGVSFTGLSSGLIQVAKDFQLNGTKIRISSTKTGNPTGLLTIRVTGKF